MDNMVLCRSAYRVLAPRGPCRQRALRDVRRWDALLHTVRPFQRGKVAGEGQWVALETGLRQVRRVWAEPKLITPTMLDHAR